MIKRDDDCAGRASRASYEVGLNLQRRASHGSLVVRTHVVLCARRCTCCLQPRVSSGITCCVLHACGWLTVPLSVQDLRKWFSPTSKPKAASDSGDTSTGKAASNAAAAAASSSTSQSTPTAPPAASKKADDASKKRADKADADGRESAPKSSPVSKKKARTDAAPATPAPSAHADDADFTAPVGKKASVAAAAAAAAAAASASSAPAPVPVGKSDTPTLLTPSVAPERAPAPAPSPAPVATPAIQSATGSSVAPAATAAAAPPVAVKPAPTSTSAAPKPIVVAPAAPRPAPASTASTAVTAQRSPVKKQRLTAPPAPVGCETQLWTDKYKPKSLADIVGNEVRTRWCVWPPGGSLDDAPPCPLYAATPLGMFWESLVVHVLSRDAVHRARCCCCCCLL